MVSPACDLFEQGHGSPDAFVNFLESLDPSRLQGGNTMKVLAVVETHAEIFSRTSRSRAGDDGNILPQPWAHLWVGNYGPAQMHETEATANSTISSATRASHGLTTTIRRIRC